MLLASTLLLMVSPAVPDCAGFATIIGEPIVISVQPVAAEALGGKAVSSSDSQASPGVLPSFVIGSFLYRGHGIAISSSDSRFQGIVLDAPTAPYHRCGYRFDAPSGWNAHDPDLSRSVLRFQQAPGLPGLNRGSTAAAIRGSAPKFPGYQPGASWPVYASGGNFFVGLMHPIASGVETLIVAFADKPGLSPARVLARLPMRFEALSVMPGLHLPLSYLNLEGRDEKGRWQRVVLELSSSTVAALAEGIR